MSTLSATSPVRTVACVGSRMLDPSALALLTAIGTSLVTAGWIVHCGGDKGADQAFAQGAAHALGTTAHAAGGLIIHLPWASYEQRAAADATVRQSGGRALIDSQPLTPNEWRTATRAPSPPDRFNPNDVPLLADNVRILCPQGLADPVHLVIAYPSNGRDPGGDTDQAFRLAESFGIPLHDLRDPTLRAQYAARVAALACPKSPETAPALGRALPRSSFN